TRTEDFRETSRLLSSLDRWPAITEIEQPALRSGRRLTGRAHTVRSTRIPARSHRVNFSENQWESTWEYGNRTGFLHDLQESSERMRAKATLAPSGARATLVPCHGGRSRGVRPPDVISPFSDTAPQEPPRADATAPHVVGRHAS